MLAGPKAPPAFAYCYFNVGDGIAEGGFLEPCLSQICHVVA